MGSFRKLAVVIFFIKQSKLYGKYEISDNCNYLYYKENKKNYKIERGVILKFDIFSIQGNMAGFYENEVECPICKNKYKVTKVLSRRTVVKSRDSDFCPHYKGKNPIFYSVNVCPHCGYAAFDSDNNEITIEEINLFELKMKGKWKYQELNSEKKIDEAIKVYKLLLLTYKMIDKKESDIAKVCLRLAWLYRYKNDKENEMKFLENMVKNNEMAFTKEDLTVNLKNELEIMFVTAETQRKLGNYKDAIKWFMKVNTHEEINKYRVIKLRNKEQWSLAIEEYRSGVKCE